MVGARTILLVLIAPIVLHARAGGPQIIENKGQWPGAVTYQAALDGAILWFERDALLIDLFDAQAAAQAHGQVGQRPLERIQRHAVRLRFTSAGTETRCTADSTIAGDHHFLLGADHHRWVRHARAFRQVRMTAVAPGCDAVFRLNGGTAKYDLHVRPGADVNAVRFTYEGATDVSLRGATLLVETTLGRITEHIPIAYQVIEGRHVPVQCAYKAFKDGYGFALGAYDKGQPLVIDPTLAFATYSGSFSNNFGYTATFDRAGFLYAGSTAFGSQYPTTTGAYQAAFAGGTGQGGNGGTDIVITKYDTTGTFLIWSTYLGGSRDEMPHSMIVDENDELLLLGTTGSTDFPMGADAFDDTFSGGSAVTPAGLGVSFPSGTDMVLARLSADGSLLRGATYLGGSANDGLNTASSLRYNYADEVRGEVLLDTQGRVWVVSCTQSTNAPVTADAAYPTYRGGAQDGYVARFDATLTTLQYASFIGGSASDACYNGALGQNGDLYLCGGTTSSDLPASPNAARPTNAGGSAEGFVARLGPGSVGLDALTYWGSTAYDQVYFIELDATDSPFIFGQTTAPSGQLIQDATYQVPAGGQFITKLSPDLSAILLGTRFGSGDGTPDISPTAFLVDVCNKIYTSGWGSSPGLGGSLSTNGLPVTPDAHQSTTDGNDLYLAVFDIDMSDLTYATYYGGGLSPEHVDGGTSRFDRRGRVYQSVCAGCQNNDDFPTSPGAWSATNNSSGCNNGVLKFDFDAPLVIAAFQAPDTLCAGVPLTLVNLSSGASSVQWDFGDGSTGTLPSPTHTYASTGTYTITLTATNPLSCNEQDSTQRTIVILPQAPQVQVMPDTLSCGTMVSLPLVAGGDGTVVSWQWSSLPDFGNTLNGTPLDSVAVLQPVISGTYFVRATNAAGCPSVDSVVVRAPFARASLIAENLICRGDTAVICSFEAGYPTLWEPADEIIDVVNNGHCALVAPDGDTEIFATLTGPFGCSWSGSVMIQASPLSGSTVTASANASTVLPGTTVQLLALPGAGVTYNWQPAASVSDPTIANPTATVQRTTTFTVTVSDGICTRSAQVTVMVYELVCGMPDIFVPNTFTPNNDGSNDLLYVRGNNIARMKFLVFDRWGELVFATEQQDVGWDGTYKGRPVDPAVFVYHLTADCADGQRYFTKGNVSVLR